MSHTEEPFSCARSRARLVFRGTICFRFSAVPESSSALPRLTARRPDLIRTRRVVDEFEPHYVRREEMSPEEKMHVRVTRVAEAKAAQERW